MSIMISGCTESGRSLAGTPSAIARLGTSMPPGTRALAPTSASVRTTALCRITAPDPTRVRSSIVQPSRCTRWPTTQPAPTVVGRPGATWITVPSWIDVRAPTVIGALSARSTADGHTDASAPRWTSPMSTASGCT
jgi:hypothetical protein